MKQLLEKTAAGFRRLAVAVSAVAALSSFSVGSARGDTLATWSPNDAKTTPVQAAATHDASLASATISSGGGVTLGTAAGYGGSSFHEAATRDDAVADGNYYQIDFAVATGHAATPDALAYTLYRSGTGPTNMAWLCSTDGGATFSQLDAFTFTASSSNKAFSLDLSGLGELAAGSAVCLRLVAWNASATGGTFYFKNSVTLTGTAETVGDIEPSIAPVGDQTASVGNLLMVPLSIDGVSGVSTTNVAASAQIAGSCGVTNAVFYYVPAEADVALSPITFAVTLSVAGKTPATASFDVTVLSPPFESFDSATKTSYSSTALNHTDFSGWEGTNCMIGAESNDNVVGAKAVRFRAGTGYLEMTADKAHGAGAVSLWLGIYKGDTQKDATVRLMLSKNGGTTWTTWNSGDIAVTTEFREVAFADVNVSGNVRLRVEYTGLVRINVDDIRITDYGQDEPPQPVEAAYLPVRNGRTVREDFDSLGTAKTATLPVPWRMAGVADLHDRIETDGAIALPYDDAALATAQYGGIGGTITTAGLYNFGDGPRDSAVDRAPGFLSSGSGYRTCALMVPVRNVDSAAIGSFRIAYSVEKYKSGNAKTVELRVSDDGENWTAAGEAFTLETTGEENSAVYSQELPPPITVSARLKRPLAPGATLYFGWFYYSNAANSSSAQALAIDDVSIRAGFPTVFSVQ